MKFFENFDGSTLSWFRTGGKIKYFAIVDNINELISIIEKYSSLKIIVIGAGSNILIRDNGIDGLVIKLSGDFLQITINNNIKEGAKDVFVEIGAGALAKNLTTFAINNNLFGCEFLDTIPGTIGGVVSMNAGCFNREVKDILYSVDILSNGKILTLMNNDLHFSYRKSKIPNNTVILKAIFKLRKGNVEEIDNAKEQINIMRQHRKEKQIIGRTCGSTFVNPKGHKVWELIDQVGMRGYKIGGAHISDKHCNFIITENGATSKDIEDLIILIKQKVLEKFGIKLKTEIRII